MRGGAERLSLPQLYDIFNKINTCAFAPVPDSYSPELRSLVDAMVLPSAGPCHRPPVHAPPARPHAPAQVQPDPKKRPLAIDVKQFANSQLVRLAHSEPVQCACA